jgi:hypothetical protein
MKLPKLTPTNVAIGAAAALGALYLFVWWSFAEKATGGGGLFQPPANDATRNL